MLRSDLIKHDRMTNNNPDDVTKMCNCLANIYGIVPFQTWGDLQDQTLKDWWDASACNSKITPSPTPALPVPAPVPTPVPVHPPGGVTTVTVKTLQKTGVTVPRELFGACLSNVSFSEPDVGSNGNYVSQMKSLNWPFLRYNGAESFMGSVFPGRGAAPNWAWVDQFRRLPQFFTGKFMMDTGILAPWMNPNDSGDIQLYCQQMQLIAQRMKANGTTVDYWEIMNEPELHGMSMASAAAALVGVAPLLKQVFPNCKVGGPALSWANPSNLGPYAQGVSRWAEFYSYHYYATGDANFSASSSYQSALGMSGAASSALGTIRNNNGGARCDLALTEYNIDYNWSPQNPLQLKAENAVFSALTLFQSLVGGVTLASLWDSYGDSAYGAISQDLSTVYPVGYVLSTLAAVLPGSMVATTVGSALQNLYVVATVPINGRVAVALVNYNTSMDHTVYLDFDVDLTALTRWEVSNSHPTGVTSSQTPTGPVSVPHNSVVILSTGFQVG